MGQFAYFSAISDEVTKHLNEWIPNISEYSRADIGKGCGFYYTIDTLGLCESSCLADGPYLLADLMEAFCNLPLHKWGMHSVEVYRNDPDQITLLFNE